MTRSIRLANGDVPIVTRPIDGPELTAQRIAVRLRTFRGEWPLDTDAGLDFVSYGDTTTVPLDVIENDVRTEILGVPGVADIADVVVDYDPTSRQVTLAAKVTLEAGDVLEVETIAAGFPIDEPTFRFLLLPSGGI